MATKNVTARVTPAYTHEGGQAYPHLTVYQQLRRSVLACLLWEDTFYEQGQDIATRIATLSANADASKVADLAVQARQKYHMRHAPLWLTVGLARHSFPGLAFLLPRVIQRADELTEFLALYWSEGRCSISAQAKKGLRKAFGNFDAYQLAKYKQEDKQVKLRDVIKMVHPKPKDREQSAAFKGLLDGTLKQHGTWEDALSRGEGRKSPEEKLSAFQRLIEGGKLGGMALLRNLRNLTEWGADINYLRRTLATTQFKRVLPFRFIAAAQAAPSLEEALEEAMFRSLSSFPKLRGRTVLTIDVSGSMDNVLAGKSKMKAYDAAAGLAMLLREVCEEVTITTFSNRVVLIPPRHGFALRDAIVGSQEHGGTYGSKAILDAAERDPDRVVCLTDEQWHDSSRTPLIGRSWPGYMINVRPYENGIGYEEGWTHVTGWSENILRYIQEVEG